MLCLSALRNTIDELFLTAKTDPELFSARSTGRPGKLILSPAGSIIWEVATTRVLSSCKQTTELFLNLSIDF